jgi:hypothetical protein
MFMFLKTGSREEQARVETTCRTEGEWAGKDAEGLVKCLQCLTAQKLDSVAVGSFPKTQHDLDTSGRARLRSILCT